MWFQDCQTHEGLQAGGWSWWPQVLGTWGVGKLQGCSVRTRGSLGGQGHPNLTFPVPSPYSTPSQTQAVPYLQLLGLLFHSRDWQRVSGSRGDPPLAPQPSCPVNCTPFSSAWFFSCHLEAHGSPSSPLLHGWVFIRYLSAAKALGNSYPLTNWAVPGWNLPKKPGKSLSAPQQVLGDEW